MIFDKITSAKKIAIFTHTNPDGDALGSTLGLMGFLEDRGKQFRLFLPSAPGPSLSFMVPQCYSEYITIWSEDRAETIKEEVRSCDLVIGLDFNNLGRIGDLGPVLHDSKAYKILIDHHVSPEVSEFDEIHSRTDVSSACELLYSILKTHPTIAGDCSRMNRITRESLMTGMTTDTNNFANSVYPDTLAMASELIAAGTDRNAIIRHIYFSYPERRLRAQGYVLSRLMKFTPEGLGYIIIDRHTQLRFGLQEGDTEGFVNMPLTVEGVKMSIMLKEELYSNKVRVSIRSKEGTSARECSGKFFHGGGHELASGGRLMIGEDLASIKDAAKYLKKVSRLFLKEHKLQ